MVFQGRIRAPKNAKTLIFCTRIEFRTTVWRLSGVNLKKKSCCGEPSQVRLEEGEALHRNDLASIQ